MSFHLIRKDNAGMCSNISFVAVSLAYLEKTRGIRNLSFGIPLDLYHCRWDDLFDNLYEPNGTDNVETVDIGKLFELTVGSRRDFDTKTLAFQKQVLDKYLKPKSFICDRIDSLYLQYDIGNATCVYFRGTDIVSEYSLVPFESYLDKIPEGRLWIQSDEQRFINFMLERFPDRAFTIDGFTFSKDGVAIHMNNGKLTDAVEILTITYLMSKAKYIISSQSNVCWVAMMLRGHNEGFIPNFTPRIQSKRRKNSNKWIWVLVVLVIVILIIVAVFAPNRMS